MGHLAQKAQQASQPRSQANMPLQNPSANDCNNSPDVRGWLRQVSGKLEQCHGRQNSY